MSEAPLKILFVAPYVPSLIRVRPYNFLRQLASRHEVTVLATGSREELVAAGDLRRFCKRVHLVPLSLSSSLRSCAAAALQGEPLQAAYCRSAELEGELRRLLGEGSFDLVHVEHLRAAHVEAFIPAGMPTVYDSVDCISLLLERTRAASHSLRQRVIAAMELGRTRAYEAWLLRRFDRVAVTSPEDRAALVSLAPGYPVSVVPNGVDLEYFHPMEGEPDQATLVFSGKMSYHANVTALLHFVRDIYPMVKMARPDARLLVVGSNPPAAVRTLTADPTITVTGQLHDIRDGLRGATVAVCPVTVKVGIQNKVLEAMAMGIPVVSTPEGVSGLEAVAGSDLLVGGDPAEFAEQVCRLLDDTRLQGRLAEAGRRYVEGHHRWESAARLLEGLYVEVAGSRESEVVL